MNRPTAAGSISNAQGATRSENRLNKMAMLVLKRVDGRLASLMAATAVLLSACTLPGMHMDSAPVIPVTSAGDQPASDWLASSSGDAARAESDSEVQLGTPIGNGRPATTVANVEPVTPAGNTELAVPISDINVALIQRLRQEGVRRSAMDQPRLFSAPAPYTLGAGDVLQITVWDHPELTAAMGTQTQNQVRPSDAPAGFVVDQGGNITFPYAGVLNVMGLRTDQVQAQLYRRLTRVYREPQITVRIGSFRAKKVYIDGEVHTPGVQPINDVPMTLYEAISRAGGFTSAADQSRMELLRDDVSYPVNLTQMIDNRSNPSNILLKDGDLLRVASRDANGVFVMGEINKPMTALPLRTGKLTLSDALSQAGSVNMMTADATQMYVIRGGDGKQPHVYHLDGQSPVSMVLANQFELQPKDVVYVDSTGLARFSRVLSQLLPAINAGLTAAIVTR
ncbi:polysaccharide biosynthesis/export family protein [Caballeronia sp. SBC1]|uniref:polysaccharide biosynthesis/export family protein n=1 Tax=Caballeronia sp. SBC1 TaxID=2705548 RepID=UPI0035302F46